jgi:hypothetical protein
MGITRQSGKFLVYAKKQGVDFARTLMLGRQESYLSSREFAQILTQGGLPDLRGTKIWDRYAEPLFEILGSQQTDSLDFSEYEGATIIHDLNNDIPDKLKSIYSVVFDGGTLEHVFNFPVAIRNCMSMLAVGGHFVSITPANNQLGHGFYQFSPELFYSLFTEKSGFKMKAVLIGIETSDTADWEVFEVADPSTVKERVMLTNNMRTHLMVIAEKIGHAECIPTPYQSDYATTWQSVQQNISTSKKMVRKFVPRLVRDFIWKKFRTPELKKTTTAHLGRINMEHFKKISI